MILFHSSVVFVLFGLSILFGVGFESDNVFAEVCPEDIQNIPCGNGDGSEKMADVGSILELSAVTYKDCQKTEFDIPIMLLCLIGDNGEEENRNTLTNGHSQIPFLLPFP